jgi:AcrR family transcriptional regulator
MTSERAIEPRRRGRPRSEKAREAILEAAAELLLARGLEAVSMDEVAERAGVSKATIYRWWPTKQTLALDALYHEWAAPAQRWTSASLRGDLLSLLRHGCVWSPSGPYGRVIAALITEAQTDPAFAE